jgi:hypothetical protein
MNNRNNNKRNEYAPVIHDDKHRCHEKGHRNNTCVHFSVIRLVGVLEFIGWVDVELMCATSFEICFVQLHWRRAFILVKPWVMKVSSTEIGLHWTIKFICDSVATLILEYAHDTICTCACREKLIEQSAENSNANEESNKLRIFFEGRVDRLHDKAVRILLQSLFFRVKKEVE